MNEFQNKALLNSIRSCDFDIDSIVFCSTHFNSAGMYFSKIKINNAFLYVISNGNEENTNITSLILSNIKSTLSKLQESNNSINALINFTQDQLINKLNFDKKFVHSYRFVALRDYARDLSSLYENGHEFIENIDKIDFDKFYEKCTKF